MVGKRQRLRAPNNWIGSDAVNLFQVVCELLELVQHMKAQLAVHIHVPGSLPSPANSPSLTRKAAIARGLSDSSKAITLYRGAPRAKSAG
jgi:hypothetical protein